MIAQTATGQRTGFPVKAHISLMLISLCLLTPGLFSLPVMDRDEARYAQASKQMIETGDYIDIRFQQQTRYVKPVMTYWLQTTSAHIFGKENAPIWAYRLPSLLAALIAIQLTAMIGARAAGPPAGWLAGFLLAASLLISMEARTAKTDALLLAATTAGQYALFRLWRERNEAQTFIGLPLLFWSALGCSILIKGPITLLVIVMTMVPLSLWTKNWSWLKQLKPLAGLALTLTICMPWLIAIIIKTESQFLEDSIGHALLGKIARSDDSHGMPPGYYQIVYFGCFWPASLFTALQLVNTVQNRNREIMKYFICWLWPSLILFELIVTKLPHYTLPLYPAIAILTALAILNARQLFSISFVRKLHTFNLLVFALFTLALSALPLVTQHYFNESFSLSAWLAAGLGCFIVGLSYTMLKQITMHKLYALITITALFYGVVFTSALPSITQLWPSARLATILKTQNCKSLPIALAGYPEPSNIFYLGTQTQLTTGQMAARHIANKKACAITIIEQRQMKHFAQTAAALKLKAETLQIIKGVNLSKGQPMKLHILYATITRESRTRPK